uniref:Uncharacterized protein n=1 Tax=Phytophthora ramorum TaxID=164328 RepID=H3GUX2_PHYRM
MPQVSIVAYASQSNARTLTTTTRPRPNGRTWSVAGRGSRQTPAPKHRERDVFLNLDATAASLTSLHDVRLNFEALSDHLCGARTSAVVMHQVATSSKTSPHIAQALETFGWTLKIDNVLQTQKGAATANGKKLVLAMGGAGMLQSQSPGRVVVKSLDDVLHDSAFLKKKLRRCSSEVVALRVAAPDAAQRAMEACGEDGAVKILSKAVTGGNDRKRQDQAEDRGAANAMNAAWGVDMSGNAFLKEQDQHSLHTSSWKELNAGDLIGSEVEFAKWGLKTCTLDDIKMAKAPFSMPISITSNFLARKLHRLLQRALPHREVGPLSGDQVWHLLTLKLPQHPADWPPWGLHRRLDPRSFWGTSLLGSGAATTTTATSTDIATPVSRVTPDPGGGVFVSSFDGELVAGYDLRVQAEGINVNVYADRTKQAKPKTTMVTEIYYRKALAQMKNKQSLLEEKHSLLEDEHAQMKTKHAKLEEEHAELLNERNDLEGDTWLWMMQNNKLHAQLKELQAEHAKWKAECASLVKEVERKVAELEVEQERKLAEADQLAKEREQALMAKVAALESKVATLKASLKSEVASLQRTIQQKDDDFDSFRRSSKEATDKVVKDLAEAKAETMKHQRVIRTLRTARENGAKTALSTTNPVKERRFPKTVEVSAPTQQREALVVLQEEQRQRLREKSSSYSSRSTVSRPTTTSSRASTKTTASPATLRGVAKAPAQTQRPVRKQELKQPNETKRAPAKVTPRWEQYKNQRSGPSSAATSSTSSSPEISPRSAA